MRHFVGWMRHGTGREGGDLLRQAPRPFYTRQEIIYRNAAPGDVLWLLTSMKYKDRIVAPALMGRFQIGDTRRQVLHTGHTILLPDETGSCYFPMHNCFDLLKELRFAGKADVFDPEHCDHCQDWKRRGKPYSGIGLHFMRTKTLTAEGHERLEIYKQEVLSKKSIFISYRWSDNPLFALSLVESLIQHGLVVWWDQWMVSTLTFIRQGADIPPQLLQETLDHGVRNSTLFVALVTDLSLEFKM